jgi:hypothetical protein
MTKLKIFEKSAHYTTFDNDILDHLMARCKPNTWKVVCAVLRKTIGWVDDGEEGGRKVWDEISYSQFQELTGIQSKTTLSEALQDALENAYILRRKTGKNGAWEIRYAINREYVFETTPENGQVTTPENGQVLPETTPESGHTKAILKSIIKTNISEKQELAEQEPPALPPAQFPTPPVQPPVQPTRKLAKEDSLSLTLRFMTKQQDKQSTLRLESFPEDVREIIGKVCELWNLTPPVKNNGARKSGDFAYWIQGARDLQEACGDIGMPVIEKMREDYERSMKKNHDVVPYQVATPKSLIRVAQSTYAVMSQPSLGNQGGDASETDLDNYLKSGSR